MGDNKLYDKILEVALKRSIIIPSAEIYNPIAGFYDYGPVGALIKRKIENQWRQLFIRNNGFHEIETASIYPEIVFRASGHADHFADPLVTCKKCGTKTRADKLLEDNVSGNYDGITEEELTKLMKQHNIKCPKCKGELSDVARFALMFQTTYAGSSDNIAYLRPETAQGMFLDFSRIFNTYGRLPIGIGQIGKAFRNEISPRRILIRMREFNQMELEYFFNPEYDKEPENYKNIKDMKIPIAKANSENVENITIDKAVEKAYITNKVHGYFIGLTKQFYDLMGVKSYRFRQLNDKEKAHYAKGAVDLESETSFGWIECVSIAHRSDYDLSSHAKISKKKMEIVDDRQGKKIMPNVIEPSFGFDRLFWTILENSYRPATEDKKWEWFDLPIYISPYHAAVYPLVKKDESIMEIAQDLTKELRKELDVIFKETGSIGKRYARADEIGVAYTITIDYDSIKDNTATIRFRNDGKQIRVPINTIKNLIVEFTTEDVRTLEEAVKIGQYQVV